MINMNQFMKQAQDMQKKMQEMQDNLGNKIYQGTAGGGAINVTINGKHEVVELKIDPEVVNRDDVEILEDLVIAAMSDAKKKMDADSDNLMSSAFGGMKLPPGFKMPF